MDLGIPCSERVQQKEVEVNGTWFGSTRDFEALGMVRRERQHTGIYWEGLRRGEREGGGKLRGCFGKSRGAKIHGRRLG